ncbi:hypothetical protein FOZ60_013702 [Perkinsus olseni]|uniref:Ectonucleotide pyrophosphatase phosphodiesterase n=1 Tax=Perkinsus olseni TaxID=32597 RepID=A0A7J6P842_PEROL|nr:hypothetical protein FOZ60_013702 [Perkinsus olseni]
MSTLLLRVLFLVAAPIGVSAVTDSSAGGDGWPNGKFKRTIIIGIDGLGGNYLKYMDRTLTPKLWDIINSPAACYNLLARTEYPLDSAPNWVAVQTGMTPSETGILNNKWRVDALDPQSLFDDRVPPVSGPGQLPPTIFSVAKKYNKDIRTASVYSWEWLDKLVDEKSLDHHFMSNDDDGKTADDLIEQLNSDNPPHLAFIQLSEVDNAGHTFSWGSDEYYAALKHMEEIIVNIVGTLRVKEIAKETLIVITSDHGG